MGYNIGLRLIEDFLAKTNMGKCANFRETAETIAKVRLTSRLAFVGGEPFSSFLLFFFFSPFIRISSLSCSNLKIRQPRCFEIILR